MAQCLLELALACASAQPYPSSYVLGPDDQVLICALKGLDLGDQPVLIGTNGNITLPPVMLISVWKSWRVLV